MTTKEAENQITEQTFVEKLTDAVKNLTYPSESDEKIKVIDWQADNPAPFDVLLLKKYLGLTPKMALYQAKWEEFFERVLKIEDWFAEEDKQKVERFQQVKDLIINNLEHIQYFRAGHSEVEAYVIGKDIDGKWKGLKTLIIET